MIAGNSSFKIFPLDAVQHYAGGDSLHTAGLHIANIGKCWQMRNQTNDEHSTTPLLVSYLYHLELLVSHFNAHANNIILKNSEIGCFLQMLF